ncbi:MAG: peptidylprolyl isomerase [Leptospiraceae bacterium]|nr:peptidylprolyl isomerase [Leptospiraceae bacterium]MCB1320998.1 peptidylprolyl isomerase [Leptospiraceae bacterium]
MQVAKDKVVSIHYTLTSGEGNVIDSSDKREPFAYLHGSGMIIPGLETALEGASAGDNMQVDIKSDDAYGPVDESLRFSMEREQFGDQSANLQPGMQFQARTPEGVHQFTIIDVQDQQVAVDGNHPLAGMDLHFDVNVIEVREATQQELEHGHVHLDGHDH